MAFAKTDHTRVAHGKKIMIHLPQFLQTIFFYQLINQFPKSGTFFQTIGVIGLKSGYEVCAWMVAHKQLLLDENKNSQNPGRINLYHFSGIASSALGPYIPGTGTSSNRK